jgi:hypothetical protein
MAVAAYLENGGYDRHLRAIRQEYRKNLSAFQLAVQRYFPDAPPAAGRPPAGGGKGVDAGVIAAIAAAVHQYRTRPK